jgi:ADP-heptose:LPS heptosyltransferase
LQDTLRPQYSALHKLSIANAIGVASLDCATDFLLSPQDEQFASFVWKTRGWDARRHVIALFVHSRRTHKRWPLASFAEVIRRIITADLGVPLLLMSPDDDSASEVAKQAALADEHLIRVADLGQLGAILKCCALFVGNDGGPKHLAVAANTPTITIFGAEPPAYWTPPDTARHIALSRWQPEIPVDPHEALEDILPTEVLAAIKTILVSQS